MGTTLQLEPGAELDLMEARAARQEARGAWRCLVVRLLWAKRGWQWVEVQERSRMGLRLF